jgi:hypothetical protein
VVRYYHGYFQGYHVQAAVTRDQIIVAAEVTRAATDCRRTPSHDRGDEPQPAVAWLGADQRVLSKLRARSR